MSKIETLILKMEGNRMLTIEEVLKMYKEGKEFEINDGNIKIKKD